MVKAGASLCTKDRWGQSVMDAIDEREDTTLEAALKKYKHQIKNNTVRKARGNGVGPTYCIKTANK